MKVASIWLLLMTTMTSCQPIVMKFYGIKKPDIENEKTITQKASKYDLKTTNIISVSSNHFLEILNGQGIPDASIYDRNGKYIEYRSSDSICNAGLFSFIPTLNKDGVYNKPDSADLKTEMIKFRDLRGNILTEPEPADFYLLIYWSVWTGKLNKDHVKIWEDLAMSNNNCRIEIIKVNLDIQEYWDPIQRNELRKALRKT